MANKTTVTFNIDQDVKEKAAEIFSSLGMNFKTGLDVYLRAVVRTGGIPFTLSSSDTQPVQPFSSPKRTISAHGSNWGRKAHTEPMDLIGEYDPVHRRIMPGHTGQGVVYKNYSAFEEKSDEICYVPEHGFDYLTQDRDGYYSLDEIIRENEGYTYQDILDLCKGNTVAAREIFYAADWAAPNYDEWLMEAGLDDLDNSSADIPSLSDRMRGLKETSQEQNNHHDVAERYHDMDAR